MEIKMTDIIDATDPNNLSNKILDEHETRKRLLKHARVVGCERDMLILFAKCDKQMKLCTNEQEKKDIGKMFCVEVFNLIDSGGQLYVDGQLVCDNSNKDCYQDLLRFKKQII